MSPLTDKVLSCFATYGNQIGNFGEQKPVGGNLRSLILGIFNIMIPEKIEKLSLSDVLEIREEYSELREAATNVINRLSIEFSLRDVVDETRANKLINEALKKFENEIEKFRKKRLQRIFKDWRIQSVATILGMIGGYITGGPVAAIALATGSAGISIMNHIAGKEAPSDIQKTIQYFSEVQKKVDINEFAEGLINYRRIVLGEKDNHRKF